jgi:hypothetical protein
MCVTDRPCNGSTVFPNPEDGKEEDEVEEVATELSKNLDTMSLCRPIVIK